MKGLMGRLTQPKTQCKNTRLEVCGHGPWVHGPYRVKEISNTY